MPSKDEARARVFAANYPPWSPHHAADYIRAITALLAEVRQERDAEVRRVVGEVKIDPEAHPGSHYARAWRQACDEILRRLGLEVGRLRADVEHSDAVAAAFVPARALRNEGEA